jgi:hypothetical protein
MLQRGLTPEHIAATCDVDPKTAERWIKPGRQPHREHRWTIARLLNVDEVYLWPRLAETDGKRRNAVADSEIVSAYANRASVPRDTWLAMLSKAERNIDVLVFSGTFFAQTNPHVAQMLTARARDGVRVRLCFGDPTSHAVDIRDREEGLRGTLASKIRASLTYYKDLPGVEGCEVRLHGSTLYASIFRYDNDMMVNPHIWGMPASANPIMHMRRLDGGGWFDQYVTSFDTIWDAASPWMNLREGVNSHGEN